MPKEQLGPTWSRGILRLFIHGCLRIRSRYIIIMIMIIIIIVITNIMPARSPPKPFSTFPLGRQLLASHSAGTEPA